MNEITRPETPAAYAPAASHVQSVARESAETGQIAAALVSALGRLRNPPRNRSVEVSTRGGGKYAFRYATLDKILDLARPVLAEEGLVLFQPITSNEKGGLVLLTRLLHRSGEWMETSIPLPAPGSDPQSLGSAVTYLRRYAATALLGIASDEDDDGNRAAGNSYQDRTPKRDRLRDEADTQTDPVQAIGARARGARGVDDGIELLRHWNRETPTLETKRGVGGQWETLVRAFGVGVRNSLGQMPASAAVRAVRMETADELKAYETAWGGEWAHTLMLMQEEAPEAYKALQHLSVANIGRVRKALGAPPQDGPPKGGDQPPPNAEGGAGTAPNGDGADAAPKGAGFPLIGADTQTRSIGNARDWLTGIKDVGNGFGGDPAGLRKWVAEMRKAVDRTEARAPKAAAAARSLLDRLEAGESV